MNLTSDTVRKVSSASLVFHGSLSKFGEFETRNTTGAAMLRAAFLRYPELRQKIREGEYRVYRDIVVSGQELEVSELHCLVAKDQKIHIVPVAEGNKGKGMSIGKTILGAVIAVAAVAGAFFTGGGTLALGAVAISALGTSVTFGAIAVFGVMMMLGGVASMLGGTAKKTSSSSSQSNDASTSLTGTVNSTEQGGCIPLIYGRKVRVGSTVGSLSYSAQEWSLTDNSDDIPSGQIADAADTGGKGKGGSGSGGGTREAPNNVRSKAVVHIIDIIGQGPGVKPYTGLDENGAKSIYFNGTPLMASDGTYNFEGVKWAWRTGEEDQDPVPGFPSAESTVSVSTKVNKDTPVIQSIQSDTATQCRVILQFPSLYKTDTSSGVLNPIDTLEYQIQVRTAGETDWRTVVSDNVNGKKCISPYEREYVFDLPGSTAMQSQNQWDVRVVRLTDDNNSASVANDLYFQYVDMITTYPIMYSGVAYCALIIDSSVFGDSIPTRTYDVTGKDVKVPANYDADARTYATTGTGTSGGTWDGLTWKVASSCDDPCWNMLDVLQGDFGFNVPDAQLGTIEYDLFEASQYACQFIDDGYGGKEARYALNVCITSSGDAYTVLQQFASAFRGLCYYANGGISVSADMPRAPVMLVTNANVTDGNFSYEGTADTGRHNIAYVSYQRIEGSTALKDIETYTDFPNVSAVGPRSLSVDAFGETRRGSAIRCGHWYVDTELYQTQTVTYTCSIDHAAVRPGEIIQIADAFYQGARKGGRVRPGATNTQIPLDSVFDEKSDLKYSLKCIAEDGSILYSDISKIETKTDEKGVSYSLVTVGTEFPSVPAANTIWIITEPTSGQVPQWRVVSIVEKSSGLFQVTALFHDPAKFDRVEKNLDFNEVSYSDLPNLLPSPLSPPKNISVQDYTEGEGTTTTITAVVGFTDPKDPKVLGFTVRMVDAVSGGISYYDAGTSNLYEIKNVPKSSYIFGVRSYGKNGTVSAWIDSDKVTVDGKPIPPSAPTGLAAQGGTRKISLNWNTVNIRNLLHYHVQRASDNHGVPNAFADLVFVSATSFTDDDSRVLKPETTMWYRVRAVDTYGNPGDWSSQVSAETTYLLTDDLEADLRNTASVAKQLQQSLGSPEIITGDKLPDTAGFPEGKVISFVPTGSTDGVLYKNVGGKWSQMVSGVSLDDTGKITSDLAPEQAEIDASKIQGQLTSDQIADLDAAKVSGKLSDEVVSEIDLAKIQGKITQTQITDGSVSTSKLSANSVTTDKLASGSVSADKVAANAITVAKLAANSVTAQKLAAGAVTTEKLSVGSPDNLILNSCCDIEGSNLSGWAAWVPSGSNYPAISLLSVSSATITGAIWNKAYLQGYGTGAAGNLSVGSPPGSIFNIASPFVSVVAGSRYFARLLINYSSGCKISLRLNWIDVNKNWISSGADGNGTPDGTTFYGDSTKETGYLDLNAFCVAPANAAYGYIVATITSTVATAASANYAIFTKAQFAKVSAQVTEPLMWVAGSATTIDGSSIKTGTLNATKIVAGSITGDKLAIRTITAALIQDGAITATQIAGGTITTNQIAANTIRGANILANTIGVREIVANCITAAQIQAGAIGTDQLAARAITAEKLAVQELIVDQAQIGSLVVGTSKIQDNAVTIFASSFVSDRSTSVNINANSAFSGILSWGVSWAAFSGSPSVTVTVLQSSGGGTQGTLAIEKFVVDGSISGSCPFISNSASASFSIGVSVSGNANVAETKLCVMGRMK